MDLHHPAVRSLALPLAIGFVAAGALRQLGGPGAGARWAAAGVPLALLASIFLTLGWTVRPLAVIEKLPWIYALVALAGVALERWRADLLAQWLATGLLWALVVVVLGQQPMLARMGSWLVGMAVIGAALYSPPGRADAAAMLVVAALGLAALAMLSGSALLFELALALAAGVGGVALWLWPVSRIRLGACGLVVALLAWLSLAQSTALLTGAPPLAALLLAGAFSSSIVVRAVRGWLHGGEPRAWVQTLCVAFAAALWVAAALALAHWGGPAFGAHPAAPGADDAYYAPRW